MSAPPSPDPGPSPTRWGAPAGGGGPAGGRWWRGRLGWRGWGVVLVLAPLGWLGWAWLLYAGLRARCWRWVAESVLQLAVVIGELFGIAAIPTTNPGLEAVVSSAVVLIWLAVVVHGFAVRRGYMRYRIEPWSDTDPAGAVGLSGS